MMMLRRSIPIFSMFMLACGGSPFTGAPVLADTPLGDSGLPVTGDDAGDKPDTGTPVQP